MKLRIFWATLFLYFCFFVDCRAKVDPENKAVAPIIEQVEDNPTKDLLLIDNKYQEWLKKRAENSKEKFNHYISKYFPKVFSVRERFFSKMTPEDIANGLKEIVEMISTKPWEYVEQIFKQVSKVLDDQEKKVWKDAGYDLNALPAKLDNKSVKKWLKKGGGAWEFIVDQLCFYNEFIEFAKVDLDTKSVFLKKQAFDKWDDFSDFKSFECDDNENLKSLKEYWLENGFTIYYDFYNLFFLKYKNLFIEAIWYKDLDFSSRYFYELRTIMGKLNNSGKYESKRQKNLETYKELLDILKKRETSAEENLDTFSKGLDEWVKYYCDDV
jgi:hypothetical protein